MVSRLYLVRPFSLFFPRYFHFSFASTNYARLILFISCLSHLDCWSLGSVDHQTDSHLPLPQPWHMLSPDSSFLLPVRAGNSSVYFTLFPSIIFSMLQAPQTTSGRTAKERTWSLTGFPSENTSANWNTHATEAGATQQWRWVLATDMASDGVASSQNSSMRSISISSGLKSW